MEFDITNLDKRLLIQALFAHSAPRGFGIEEYKFRDKVGDNVDALTDEECDIILLELNDKELGSIRLLDYPKGKPMKLDLYKKNNGRILASTEGYDYRNGKYRYFEALLNIFSMDEILITKKGYSAYSMSSLPEDLIRPKEQETIFKNLLKNMVQKENEFGKYWVIDESKIKYTPPFMEGL